MAKTTSEIPQEKLEAFDRLINTRPDIERKGKSNPLHLSERTYVHAPR